MSMEGNFEYDLTDDGAAVTKYNGSDASVIIPDTLGGKPIVEIGKNVFQLKTKITDVKIPDTVTKIGMGAFMGCFAL